VLFNALQQLVKLQIVHSLYKFFHEINLDFVEKRAPSKAKDEICVDHIRVLEQNRFIVIQHATSYCKLLLCQRVSENVYDKLVLEFPVESFVINAQEDAAHAVVLDQQLDDLIGVQRFLQRDDQVDYAHALPLFAPLFFLRDV
jgi:hypothetical protein